VDFAGHIETDVISKIQTRGQNFHIWLIKLSNGIIRLRRSMPKLFNKSPPNTAIVGQVLLRKRMQSWNQIVFV